MHELVSRAEAFRATREETDLLSDDGGRTVSVAHVQGDKPGKSFAQWQRSTNDSNAVKSKGGSTTNR